ncbi:MAG TPA: hypothetical protein VH186_15730 [Chloroflexia bacterium]|nr:hypothetical protein [Chloroflexia bacterium]
MIGAKGKSKGAIEGKSKADYLEGRHLVQEIVLEEAGAADGGSPGSRSRSRKVGTSTGTITNNKEIRKLLESGFTPASSCYRGLVMKYHTYVDRETGEPLAPRLPEGLPTRPLTLYTPNLIERLTGLLLQLGFLTLKDFDAVIRSSNFFYSNQSNSNYKEEEGQAHSQAGEQALAEAKATEPEREFKPAPELEEAIACLLEIEALDVEDRQPALLALDELQWARFLAVHRARNRLLLRLLFDQPGLIGDPSIRTWYVIRLQSTLPSYVVQAQWERNLQLYAIDISAPRVESLPITEDDDANRIGK